MNTQQINSFIKEQIALGNISKQDLLSIVNSSESEAPHTESSKNLINIFYAIGGIIVTVGAIILVAENWGQIGFFGRILVTLGLSLGTYSAGLIFAKPEQRVLSQVMFTISVALAPIGIAVLLSEAHVDFTIEINIMISLILAFIYGFALYISKRVILKLFIIAFLTWTYFATVSKLFDFNLYHNNHILEWATMVLGISYVCLAYINTEATAENRVVKTLLYFFGTGAVLEAGISFGGIFDLLFIAIIFAVFYASVYLKQKVMLLLAAVFLMAHIIKLTSKYFVDSVGWPVALMAIGFLVIGIGYGTFYLNRKYLVK